jgi:hypothetical protein
VEVGGTIGVQVLCSDAIACTAESAQRQNVLTPRDSKTWTWDIVADSPGAATVKVVATTYDQNSDIVLAETPPISQTVTVTATSSYVWLRIAGRLQWLIGFIGVGAIGSAGTWVFRRLRNRYAKKRGLEGAVTRGKALPGPTPTPAPAEPLGTPAHEEPPPTEAARATSTEAPATPDSARNE